MPVNAAQDNDADTIATRSSPSQGGKLGCHGNQNFHPNINSLRPSDTYMRR